MPDNKPEAQGFELFDRLASLGEQFNTTKQFGMMGLLEQQQQERSQPAPVADAAAPASDAGKDSNINISEILDPINASLREFRETTTREIGGLRNEMSSFRQAPAPQAEDAGEVDPATQRLSNVERSIQETRLNTAWERARNALNAAKIKHGNDFEFSEGELQDVWKQHIGNNVGAAEGTNWDVYMQQQFDSRRAPRLEKRMKELESELAKAKSGGSDPVTAGMAAMPRANRNGAPMPASAGVVNDFDEDVYRRASARMGKRIGSFAGFNRLLVDEQNKKLLRTAS